MSVGAYEKKLLEASAGRLDAALVRRWGDHPKFLEAVAGRVAQALQRFPAPDAVHVLFTAHSLPERILATGDRYPDELRASAAAVAQRAGLAAWSFSYQSAGATPDPWLGLEAGRQHGGMIVTERHDGFIVEGGPDGFLAAEPDIQELARQLGIEGRLVDQVARGSTLWTGRRLEPLAEGKAAELLGIQVNGNVGGFRTFATGMADVVEALVACLVPPPRLRTTQGVTAIAQAARGWRLSFTGASSLDAEAVILAIPAWLVARLLAGLGVSAARALDTVLYAPSITVSLAYRADQVPATLEGAGFVAAPDSGSAVRACTYAWRKYPNRAPGGYALVRAFVGPVDGDPAAIAHAELAAILGMEA